ncbi:MAG: hypothetical protein ACR2LQ_13595 [Acidimicrobiales bacterium]
MSTAERFGYALAILILVVGGAIVRTPILNWVAGPVIVVACVMLTTRGSRRGDKG